MKYFSGTEAALLVREAVQFGAIKLNAPPQGATTESAAKCAERDALYLVTLLNALQLPL